MLRDIFILIVPVYGKFCDAYATLCMLVIKFYPHDKEGVRSEVLMLMDRPPYITNG